VSRIMKKYVGLFLAILMVGLLVVGCSGEAVSKELILATTTSTENSGLLSAILPEFEKETGFTVKVVAVGTGKALQMGRDGEADVLLVHAKSSEEEFVAEEHGIYRKDVMYNDFVIIGSNEDPAGVKEAAGDDVLSALKMISEANAEFVTRGDDSGTHKKEMKFWAELGIEPAGDWYISSGQGMGATITIANEKLAYTMSDRATYLSRKDELDLGVLVEGDSKLFNQYGVIPVNPEKSDKINNKGAEAFVEWITGDNAEKLIKEFGVEKFGQPLFIPNAE